MSYQDILDDFKGFLKDQELNEVEVSEVEEEGVKHLIVTFPVYENGYPDYEIVASWKEDGTPVFWINYCTIPDVDRLELLEFINELNGVSMLNIMDVDGELCFAYMIPEYLITDGETFGSLFADICFAVDELKETVIDAFGIEEDDVLPGDELLEEEGPDEEEE